jgi:hypothetical protein
MRLEELGHLKNAKTLSGNEPATFRLVALCLNQLRYCVHRTNTSRSNKKCMIMLKTLWKHNLGDQEVGGIILLKKI